MTDDDSGWQDLRNAQATVAAREDDLADARSVRDQIMRDHAAGGVTAYRLAQVTGLSQPAVANIIR